MAKKMTEQEHIDMFWGNVKKGSDSDCWEWTWITNGAGYGSGGGSRGLSHRYSYVLHYGEIPEGMCVCHSCDNKKCVNPKHLWLGTQSDNAWDKSIKGRNPGNKGIRGVGNPKCKMTESDVVEVRKLYALGEYRQIDLAKMFGVTQTAISSAVRGATWEFVK